MNLVTKVKVTVLAKPEPLGWKLENGTKGVTHKLTVLCGDDAGLLKVPESVYDTAVIGKEIELVCSLREMRAKDLGVVYALSVTDAVSYLADKPQAK